LLPAPLAAEPVMRFIPDPERFPDQGQPNNDPSNFWGFTSVCLRRLLEELGFAVSRTIVHCERVLLDAKRVAAEGPAGRQELAYRVMEHIPVGSNPLEPSAWKIF
jgi:tRNA (mo5U34)-methyltransferase